MGKHRGQVTTGGQLLLWGDNPDVVVAAADSAVQADPATSNDVATSLEIADEVVAAGRRETCAAGHPYDEANTYVNPKGGRSCRICQQESRRRWRTRNAKAGLTAEQRVLRARIAAYRLHATHDPRETTKKARAAFASRFEREVDPAGILSPAERTRRADAARRACFTDLALRSSRARRRVP